MSCLVLAGGMWVFDTLFVVRTLSEIENVTEPKRGKRSHKAIRGAGHNCVTCQQPSPAEIFGWSPQVGIYLLMVGTFLKK